MSWQICHNCLKKHKPTHYSLTLNAARRHSINKIKDREILMLSVSPQGNTQCVLVLVPSHIHFSSSTTSSPGKIFATSSPRILQLSMTLSEISGLRGSLWAIRSIPLPSLHSRGALVRCISKLLPPPETQGPWNGPY